MDECLLQICKTHVDLLGNPNSLSNILEWLDTVAGVFHKLDKHHRVVPNFDYIFRLKVKCYLMKIKHYFIFLKIFVISGEVEHSTPAVQHETR